MAKSYENAGVNLEAGYEVVRRIKSHVKSTSRPGVMGNIGAFGGMFDFDGDGRLNAMEQGLEFQFFHDVILGREAEETEDEENEEEENV